MDSLLEKASYFVDDLLDFSSDVDEQNPNEEDEEKVSEKPYSEPKIKTHKPFLNELFPVLGEEELEWISNFPTLETFDIPRQQKLNQGPKNSPVSVLVGSYRVPVKPRSMRKRRKRGVSDFNGLFLWSEKKKEEKQKRCSHCFSEKTPQWRAGPMGPKTLCNACGVRFKSGRLVPEYRPASSPYFSSDLHSNSHRKITEMRREKGKG
ncbi:GATA transcription factor 7-like [Tasmannia lanceolata]|uniref:GATA transcription factor 7-like n=1 Tax=Tasmannia lanceolata TaxID=3420 RepID=UPI004063494A